jgi:hypothetical protein
MFLHRKLLPLPLLAWYFLIVPPAAGQTATTDTTGRLQSDSQSTLPDSAILPTPAESDSPGVRSDTLSGADTVGSARDSVRALQGRSATGRPDSTRLRSDTAHSSPGGDSSRSTTAELAPALRDTVLGKACGSSDSPSTVAQDLLVVMFGPGVEGRERAAVARSVGGKLLNSPESGVYYIRLRPGGGEAGLRAAADQLSQKPEVRQVGSRSCPSPSSADTASPKSSNSPPSSRSSSP